MSKKLLYLLIVLSFFSTYLSGQNIQLSDSATVSLLTNSTSNKEIYSLFGHTAIRVNDPTNSLDIVFNYGIFDFDSPNFMYRFVKGETDYMVAGYPFSQYLYSYDKEGIGVTEQIFNLSKDEKQHIFNKLAINALPENRVYRYNFFYDNCSTRPRDIIEQNVNGEIVYKPTGKNQSFRNLVHECVSYKPWTRFGIDLVIGADADKQITDKQKQFIPAYLYDSYTSAVIKSPNGEVKPLVLNEVIILKDREEIQKKSNHYKPTTYTTFSILILTIIISYLTTIKNKKKLGIIFDMILFFITGLAGCVIFYLMFFSSHPCTNPNWNIIWLNPIQLIAAILFPIKSMAKYVYYYHFINFVVLILFLLAWFLISQYFEMAFIAIVLSLFIRSGLYVLQYKQN